MKRSTIPVSEAEHPFEAIMRDAEDFARRAMEDRERNAQLPWDEDPLFKDVLVYDGPVPADSSERYGDYLDEGLVAKTQKSALHGRRQGRHKYGTNRPKVQGDT